MRITTSFTIVLLLLATAFAWFGCVTLSMPGESFQGPAPKLSLAEQQLEQKLKAHVKTLAHDIGPRSLADKDELIKAKKYIIDQLKSFGYQPKEQTFRLESWPDSASNVYAIRPGNPASDEVVVIGAHYDTAGVTPGANDNGSGVAAMLELARLLKPKTDEGENTIDATIHFVAFVNEEPPYFQSGDMGSVRYAKKLSKAGVKVVAMYSLETMGYFTNEPNSQNYPPPFSQFFPSEGNFIAFVSNTSSRDLTRNSVGAFRYYATVASEGVAVPSSVTGIDFSDHWAFWQEGYPALMITDTAFFRYAHYHEASDTFEKLNYESLARVTVGLQKMMLQLY